MAVLPFSLSFFPSENVFKAVPGRSPKIKKRNHWCVIPLFISYCLLEPSRSFQSSFVRHGEFGSPFGPASCQYLPTILRTHPGPKSMLVLSLSPRGLERSFHAILISCRCLSAAKVYKKVKTQNARSSRSSTTRTRRWSSSQTCACARSPWPPLASCPPDDCVE